MVDWDEQRELFPHYVGSLVLLIAGLATVRLALGRDSVLIDLVVVVFVVLAYPTLARLLGVAPSAWDE